jgi:hypothetical protein
MRQLPNEEVFFGLKEGQLYEVHEIRSNNKTIKIFEGGFVDYIVRSDLLQAGFGNANYLHIANIDGTPSGLQKVRIWYTEV